MGYAVRCPSGPVAGLGQGLQTTAREPILSNDEKNYQNFVDLVECNIPKTFTLPKTSGPRHVL